MQASPAPVLFQERVAGGGRRIGIASLNAPATLNALSLAMAELLGERLARWAADPGIAMVVLEAQGRALCAGGDLHGVYREMLAHPGPDAAPGIRRFFEREYGLDHAIHTYPKPVLCWGHGIVMGGGVGLLIGASHRVVTEASRLAMPEIAIGLFPDVGMSWALNRMPGKSGLFLALTGASIHAADALFAGWADYHVRNELRSAVFDALCRQTYTGDRQIDDVVVHQVLEAHRSPPEPAVGPLRTHLDVIDEWCRGRRLDDVVAAILQHSSDDPWLRGAADALARGAPSTARLAWELQHRTRHESLAHVFRLEYQAALWCCTHGDFREGIRALLVDKDRQPAWKQRHGDEVGREWADETFRQMARFAVPESLAALGG